MVEFPVYYAIAKETGLLEDLTQTWGSGRQQDPRHRLPLDAHEPEFRLSLQVVVGGKLLPYWDSMESKEMTEFFQRTRRATGLAQNSLQRPYRQTPGDEVLSYDSTRIATEAVANPYAQCGKGRKAVIRSRLDWRCCSGTKPACRSLYRMFPGQIADVSTVADMLSRFDEINDRKKIFAAVMDRGYFSLENFARFVDSKSKVIVAATMDVKWIREA